MFLSYVQSNLCWLSAPPYERKCPVISKILSQMEFQSGKKDENTLNENFNVIFTQDRF